MAEFDERDLELPRSGLPGSVILAIIGLACMMALNVLNIVLLLNVPNRRPNVLIQPAVSLVLGALIMWGLVVGHRLAWQWGRVLGLIGAILYTVVGAISLANAAPGASPLLSFVVGAVVLFVAACLWVIFFAVGARSARLHFGLQCPDCGKFTSKAADFFFNKAKCGKCKKIW